MGDITRRIDRYRLKSEPERVFELLKELRPDMERRHEVEQLRLYAIELKARQVLNSADVPSMLYVFYLNYARELHRLSSRSVCRVKTGQGVHIQVFRSMTYEFFARLGKEDPPAIAGIKVGKHGFHFSLSYKLLAQRVHSTAQTDLS